MRERLHPSACREGFFPSAVPSPPPFIQRPLGGCAIPSHPLETHPRAKSCCSQGIANGILKMSSLTLLTTFITEKIHLYEHPFSQFCPFTGIPLVPPFYMEHARAEDLKCAL